MKKEWKMMEVAPRTPVGRDDPIAPVILLIL